MDGKELEVRICGLIGVDVIILVFKMISSVMYTTIFLCRTFKVLCIHNNQT